MAAAALLAVALAGATLGAGSIVRWLEGQRSDVAVPAQPGVLRVAVRPDHPQALVTGAGFAGFDTDLAEEVGRRLGLRVQLVIPLAGLPVTGAGGPNDVASLDGSAICVVAGSSGSLDRRCAAGYWHPRAGGATVESAVEARCDDDASSRLCGTGRRMRPSRPVLETDLTAHGGVAILGTGPVLTEPRAILIDARPGGDELRTAIEAALTEIRDDGTLARLSARRFGGRPHGAPSP